MIITPLDVAISQLGVKELTGKNDGVPSTRYMKGDKLSWCAGLMLYCYHKSDWGSIEHGLKEYYRLRNVQAFVDEMKSREVFFGRKLFMRLMPCDLVFFKGRDGSDVGRGNHVGMFERFGYSTVDSSVLETIHTIEGNTGDAVKRKNYSIHNTSILGFAAPVYR